MANQLSYKTGSVFTQKGHTAYTPKAGGGRSVVSGTRRGNMYFRVDVDDTELQEALRYIQREGDDIIRDYMRAALRVAAHEAREFLLDQEINDEGTTARQVQGVRVGSSKNVYVKLAENLRITTRGNRSSLISRPYPTGLIGSRGGKLAQIHSAGKGPFDYSPNTPSFVTSSINWYLKKGQKQQEFSAPMKGKKHPGFKRVDYIGVAEEEFMEMAMDPREGLMAYVQKHLLSQRFYTGVGANYPGTINIPGRIGTGGVSGAAEAFHSSRTG